LAMSSAFVIYPPVIKYNFITTLKQDFVKTSEGL